jgi:hypothetical protein
MTTEISLLITQLLSTLAAFPAVIIIAAVTLAVWRVIQAFK